MIIINNNTKYYQKYYPNTPPQAQDHHVEGEQRTKSENEWWTEAWSANQQADYGMKQIAPEENH